MTRSIAVALALLCVVPAMAADPVTLVRDGQGTAAIVTAGNAPDTVRRAAAELQEYVERSTGARLPVLTDRRPEAGASIFIGESRFTTALGIGPEAVGPDGYKWLTGDDWLAIVGRDHREGAVYGLRNPWRPQEVYNEGLKLGALGEAGTLYGVYHFLERFLGVRWFMPGDLGTVVPRHKDVSVPALEVMVPNAAIRNLIREDKIHQIYSIMQIGQGKSGMFLRQNIRFGFAEDDRKIGMCSH